MSVFAIYSDGDENGRRVRHVHEIHDTFAEASAHARESGLAVQRFESLAEVKAFEIGPNRTADQHDAYREADERDERYTYLSEQGA